MPILPKKSGEEVEDWIYPDRKAKRGEEVEDWIYPDRKRTIVSVSEDLKAIQAVDAYLNS